ncbi:tRNA lysidine(34) synthetase TilS [Pelagovum pacificum]|uniref:tRNA(Ile)-lysidine synthase n=2 Tax=Pelagovum pacificum TaxID=2588711 RepID=A0A5C5G8L7_9RHOB|nr:tRNA lysidine(34) synthetase TilS [Pelagovum pacificum]TNY31074.1 tRNA lysidine(34) synthetase TilS [Pelagovum pacificum]
MGRLVGPDFPTDIGLAVSGGGDSMAMLHLAAGWARVFGIRLWVVTVDHGLRREAPQEAAMVADEAAGLNLPHATLRWHWDGQGNLMGAARRARLDLIGRWSGNLCHVCFAHTEDDLAEGLLMRLSRGSGVEGLSAIAPSRNHDGPDDAPPDVAGDMPLRGDGTWIQLRPLLEIPRAELRHYLKVLKIPFTDDPTNIDDTYLRARMRALLDPLEDAGLARSTLAATSRRLARARDALEARAFDVATRIAAMDHGDVLFDRDGLAATEADTQLRLLAAALQYVASADYRPREAALEAALDRVLSGGDTALHGCRLVVRGDRLRIVREYEAVKDTVAEGDVWDRRWRISTFGNKDLTVRALGPDGAAQAGRDSGAPHVSLLSAPALFDGERLIACPRAEFGAGLEVRLAPPRGEFPQCLLSH